MFFNICPEPTQKCYAKFDRQRIDGGHALCSSHGGKLPLPKNQVDVDNLRATLVEIGVERNGVSLTSQASLYFYSNTWTHVDKI